MVAFLENIWDFLLQQSLTSKPVFILYWIPVVVCIIGYTFDIVADYRKDYKDHTGKYYRPSLTVGTILGRLIVSFVPVCNLFIAVVRHVGMIISRIYDRFEYLFNIPLVPARPAVEEEQKVVPPAPSEVVLKNFPANRYK